MSVLLDKDTRVVVSGVTGSEGTFHTRRNIAYGTNVVAGVTPGKGGQRAVDDKVPVFDTVAGAVQEEGANASLIFVPARFAADSIVEAVDAGCSLVVCITEGIPTRDMAEVYPYVRAKGVALIGPNCPGLISPGKANMGIIPGEITGPGPIGLISRSGTGEIVLPRSDGLLSPGQALPGGRPLASRRLPFGGPDVDLVIKLASGGILSPEIQNLREEQLRVDQLRGCDAVSQSLIDADNMTL